MKFISLVKLTSFLIVGLLANIVAAKGLLLNKKVLSQHQLYTPIDEDVRASLEDEFLKLYMSKQSSLSDYYDLTIYKNTKKRSKRIKREVHALSKKTLGWGQFALVTRHTKQGDFFVQVTHRFNDRHTLNIANHLWNSRRVELVYANVVHRHTHKGKTLNSNSDFSSAFPSPLVAATRAWLAYKPNGVIIQLHGFNQSKRKSATAQAANMIISHGINTQSEETPILSSLKQCIQQSLKITVEIYPTEVRELGGTLNVVGKEVRERSSFTQFLHLEIDSETRKRLRQNKKESLTMFDCVERAYL
jgi:hypothetical protein